MSDYDITIKYLNWAIDKTEEMKQYTQKSTSYDIQKRALINYIESALAAAKRL